MIIGYNNLTGTPQLISGTGARLLYGAGQTALLAANQELFSCSIAYAGANNTAVSTFQVGLYDVSGGNFTTAPRIYSTTLTIDNAMEGANAAVRWITFPLAAFDLSAHVDKELAVGFADPIGGAGFNIPLATVTGAVRKNHNGANQNLPSTMATGTATNNQAWPIFFETRTKTAGGQTLDSVTPATVNNTGSITAVVSGNLAAGTIKLISGSLEVAQTASSWSYNSGTNKTTIVSAINQGGLAFGSLTVRYESGGVTLTGAVTLAPVAGNVQVPIEAPIAEPDFIFYQMESGSLANVTHIEHTDSPNTSVSAQGEITQIMVRPFQARARDASDNAWSAFVTIVATAAAMPSGVAARFSVGQATATVTSGPVHVTAFPAGVSARISVGQVSAVVSGNPQNVTAFPVGVAVRVRLGLVTAVGDAIPPPVAVGASIVPEFVVSGSTSVITRVEGDTYGVQIQFHSGGRALPLDGWGQFELVVDPARNPETTATRLMQTAGVITDSAKGKIYLPVRGDVQAGKYYFNARCITPRGDRVTFLQGIYEVQEGIP